MVANDAVGVESPAREFAGLELTELAKGEEGLAEGEAPTSAALRYLNNRYESLFYAQAKEHGLPIGSGMIESGHRHALQCRLKLPGAWWKERNANRMAKIRVIKANGKWESPWSHRSAA